MKFLYNTLYGVFAVLLVAVAALFVAPSVPFFGHLEVKIVKSGSMEPYMMTGGIVVVQSREVYVPGDVITFKSETADIPTTHRILSEQIEEGKTFFVTKGDANEEADAALAAKDAVIGKVLFTLPYVGFVLDFARQPIGFMLLIALPAMLIVVDEIEKIWKETRRMRTKKTVTLAKGTIEPLVVAAFEPVRTRVRMMEINHPVPVRVPRVVVAKTESIAARTAVPQMRAASTMSRIRPEWVMAPCAVLAVTALIANLWSIGGTVSYFNDQESTEANVLQAGTLDFTATPDGTSFTFLDGALDDSDGAVITTVTPVAASAPMRYVLATSVVSGNPVLCDAIAATVTDPFTYSGPLTALALGTTSTLFSNPWSLGLTLTPGAYLPLDTCVIDIVYSGWYAVYPAPQGGYDDEEKVRLTFTAPVPLVPFGAEFRSADIMISETDTPPAEVPEEAVPPETPTEGIEIPPEPLPEDPLVETPAPEEGVSEEPTPVPDEVITTVEEEADPVPAEEVIPVEAPVADSSGGIV